MRHKTSSQNEHNILQSRSKLLECRYAKPRSGQLGAEVLTTPSISEINFFGKKMNYRYSYGWKFERVERFLINSEIKCIFLREDIVRLIKSMRINCLEKGWRRKGRKRGEGKNRGMEAYKPKSFSTITHLSTAIINYQHYNTIKH